jgi:hypothetical protein
MAARALSTAPIEAIAAAAQPAGLAVLALLVSIYAAACFHKRRLTQKPSVSCQLTNFNNVVLSRMPSLRELYKPLLFLTNGHIETIFAAKTRGLVDLRYRREYLLVPEGAFAVNNHSCMHNTFKLPLRDCMRPNSVV